jgi:(p)ppGpp synthase/HD superfamily hydrolase
MQERQQFENYRNDERDCLRFLESKFPFNILELREVVGFLRLLYKDEKRENGDLISNHLLKVSKTFVETFDVSDFNLLFVALMHDIIEDKQQELCEITKVENSRANAFNFLKNRFGHFNLSNDTWHRIDILNKYNQFGRDQSEKTRLYKLYVTSTFIDKWTLAIKCVDTIQNMEDFSGILKEDKKMKAAKKYEENLSRMKIEIINNGYYSQEIRNKILDLIDKTLKEIAEFLQELSIKKVFID